MKTLKKILSRILLVLGGLAVGFVLTEIGLRIHADSRSQPREIRPSLGVPLHVVTDEPFLYQLNPDHPDVSRQGFPDREYPQEKPEGALRIMILGDSVAYGPKVPRELTFAEVLERSLSRKYGNVEVINTAVSGYTPYNLLQFYLRRGRSFDPDIVIVAFCMNDVADPMLHWNYAGRAVERIPPEAIPNRRYHEEHILPLMGRTPSSWLDWSLVYRSLAAVPAKLPGPFRPLDEKMYALVNGRAWPTYITGEDEISIEVLLDEESPESRWLRSMYDQLAAAVRLDGASMALVLFPLAYQLDPDYPFVPQLLLLRYCAAHSLPCLDLLPAFRRYRQEEVFLLRANWFLDIWHLTPSGHRVAAEALEEFLVGQGWLQG